jgi:hypothetical protein
VSTLWTKYIELLEAANNAPTFAEHERCCQRLYGYQNAMQELGIPYCIQSDNHYLDQGIDRPMCCGLWLDWEPAPTNPDAEAKE